MFRLKLEKICARFNEYLTDEDKIKVKMIISMRSFDKIIFLFDFQRWSKLLMVVGEGKEGPQWTEW